MDGPNRSQQMHGPVGPGALQGPKNESPRMGPTGPGAQQMNAWAQGPGPTV